MAGERAQSVGARKTVTVLFADLVESTAMAEGLDPEVLAGRLNDYFERMRSIIESHGGTVEKFIGDAVVGVFGVPVLHEDDALRAVRAGLEMQAATAGLGLRCRIGINTGEVAAVAATSSIALGHPISMAARLQQAAEPDTLLIGSATHAMVAAGVQARELTSLTVKGSTEPLRAWQVEGLVEVAPRGWKGTTPFVGRRREVGAVESALESAVREGACVVVTVVAPPGLGKSRLAAEATARLSDRARVVIGRCVPYGEGTAYAPLVEIIGGLERDEGTPFVDTLLADENDGAQVLGQLRALVAGTALSSPEETAWAFRRLLEVLSARRPAMVVIDDIHWADPALLDLVEYVATFSIGHPILLLCLSRPDLLDSRPDWTSSRPNSHTIRLQPLTADETNTLLPAAVGGDDLRRRIVAAAGGVPLFVEQMAALEQQADGELAVPATVRALMTARVDQLSRADRDVLECGAVEGETFRRATVAALLGDEAAASIGGQLMGLIRREFIRPERSPGGGDAFRFSHALLRDAVYSLMPRRRRAELHERLAELFEAGAGRADDEVIGYQLETAYRERLALGAVDGAAASLAVKAGRRLQSAGRVAMSRTDWRRATDLLTRSADLLGTAPASRVAALADLSTAFLMLPDLDQARRRYEEALAEARRLGDEAAELKAEFAGAELATKYDLGGRYPEVIALADRAIAYFAERDDSLGLAQAYFAKAMAEGAKDLGPTIGLLKKALASAELAQDQLIQVAAWDELGGAMLAGPTPYPEIRQFVSAEREWARAHGITFAEADATLGLAYCQVAAGDFDGARSTVAAVKALFASLPGVVSQHGESYSLGGQLERDVGNVVAAEAELRRAMALFEEGGSSRWWRSTAALLANVLLDVGRRDEAAQVLDDLAARGVSGVARSEAQELMTHARLAAARGDLTQAVETGRRAVAMIAGSSSIVAVARLHETLGELLEMDGQAGAARAELERAGELYKTKVFVPGEKRVSASIDRLLRATGLTSA